MVDEEPLYSKIRTLLDEYRGRMPLRAVIGCRILLVLSWLLEVVKRWTFPIFVLALVALIGCGAILDDTDSGEASGSDASNETPEQEASTGTIWTLGESGADCDATCAAAGAVYSDETRTVAGSDGTDEACGDVLAALGLPHEAVAAVASTSGAGCLWNESSGRPYRIGSPATDAAGAGRYWRRACACAL